MSETLFDVAILGSGPAGLSAAIYLGRANIKTIVFGQILQSNLYKSHLIANYFGFPEGIPGPDLISDGVNQAKKFGAEIIAHNIIDISKDDNNFKLKDQEGKDYQASHILFATGINHKKSGIENEAAFVGKGVSYCAVCDGFFFKNKKIAVVGNSEYSAEEALSLATYSSNIVIFTHGFLPSINDFWLKKLKEKNIKVRKTPQIKSLSGQNLLEKVIFSDNTEEKVDGLFIALGSASSSNFASKLGITTKGEYLKVDEYGQTNLPNIYAAGDCSGGNSQVASAVGSGCNTALTIIKKLKNLENYIQYG